MLPRSNTTTRAPYRCSIAAEASPAGPAPTTAITTRVLHETRGRDAGARERRGGRVASDDRDAVECHSSLDLAYRLVAASDDLHLPEDVGGIRRHRRAELDAGGAVDGRTGDRLRRPVVADDEIGVHAAGAPEGQLRGVHGDAELGRC